MISEKIALYPDREDVTLTTYVLDSSPEIAASQAKGAVIICPGGAYLGCSDREGEPVAMAFAAMGYHTFVLRYSVYSENKPVASRDKLDMTKPLPVKPHCVFPAPMRDLGKAMLYVREHAAQWNLDADKIAICGFSAGAHNCAMYSVYWDKPVMTEFFGVDAERLRPAAAILGYTLSDYTFMRDKAMNDPAAKGFFAISNTAFLGSPEPDDELIKAASPALLVDANTPPTFLWATADDSLVPVQHTTHMATALANAGIAFELHIYENGPHGLSTATQAAAGTIDQVSAEAATWMPHADAWLKKRFAYDLPEPRAWDVAP